MHESAGATRHISIQGVSNLRDAGGYPTASGHPLRWGRIFRSDSPHGLDPIGRRQVAALGVHTVVDLRTHTEASDHPSPFKGAPDMRYRLLPVFDEFRGGLPPTLEAQYHMQLERRDSMRSIFSALAEPGAFPALLHCTVGKDRTGVVIAMIHKLVGVADTDVVHDYLITGQLLSSAYYEPLRDRARRVGFDLSHYETFLVCEPAIMERTLAHLELAYGGAERYLLDSGVTPQEISAIRAQVLE